MSLIAENLCVSFGDTPVLKDINFELRPGEMLAVIGPNGSGKTTLLKSLLGLVRPGQGRSLLCGLPPIQAIQKFPGIAAYLPQHQNINTLLPLSVQDIVLQGFKAKKNWGARLLPEEFESASEALELVQMAGHRDRLFRSLSGGQRQRVLLALALAGKPRYLFLDEPTNALDFASIDRLYHLLAELRNLRNMAVLIITHDIGAIAGSADRIALLMHEFKYLGPAKSLPESALRDVFGCHIRLVPDDPECAICRNTHLETSLG